MNNAFIFPLTIESRKVILLDLQPAQNQEEFNNSFGNDIYIIELPVNGTNSLLTISKKNAIQSLIESIGDIPLERLTISFKYENKFLKVFISESNSGISGGTIPSSSEFSLSGGYTLVTEENDAHIQILIKKHPVFSDIDTDELPVQFILQVEDFYALGQIKLCLACRNDIKYLGFDFGSEASQMHFGEWKLNGSSIKNQPIALFNAVKSFYGGTGSDKNYEQFDDGDSALYKSKFYIEKQIELPRLKNSLSAFLKLLTTKTEVSGSNFFQQWYQVPNLKLIHGNPAFMQGYTFQSRSSNRIYPFSSIKDNIYSSLLESILSAYFSNTYPSDIPSYLRFTLLTPNIYTIQEIVQLKMAIREIFDRKILRTARKIKAIEIENISESDAAFIGCVKHLPISKGKYFIIIDCGKGTTDFSILQAEEGPQLKFKPIYRNGFAGAGNLISFGLLQSAINHIFTLYSDNEIGLKNARNYFRKILSTGPQTDRTYKLYEAVEKWKRNFNKLDKYSIEREWEEARSGSTKINNIFEEQDEQGVEEILMKINHAYDWNGYAESAVSDIIKGVYSNLLYAVQQMNKEAECGGILLTGRAFYFKPLKTAMLNKLRSIRGMEKIKCLNDDIAMNLKEVCLEGVFEKSILTYSDIASTPFQVEKGTQIQVVKKGKNQNQFFSSFRDWLGKLIKRQFLQSEEIESYNEEANTLRVINPDLANCQFMSSGKILKASWNGTQSVEEAILIQARSGIYLRLKLGGIHKTEKVIQLTEVDMYANAETQSLVLRSLFPGHTDISTFDIFN